MDAAGSSALKRLLRWEAAGGGWRVVALGAQHATVELERCDLGEVADRITSADPDFLVHLRRVAR